MVLQGPVNKLSEQLIEITPQVLLKAYACGIFPMAEDADDPALYWIDPERRGIVPLDAIRISRSLRRVVRSSQFEVRIDTAFDRVVDGCAEPSPGRDSTWINERIRKLYSDLFHLGNCHSVECWRDGELVGGLYGVSLGRAFFGESMFSRTTNASKVAFIYLTARLITGGFVLLDTQFITDHLRSLGAIEIDREAYHGLLEIAVRDQGEFFELATDLSPEAILQVFSQTS
jgi:leucyl/phenylalanyl-tRNA--protein transferase